MTCTSLAARPLHAWDYALSKIVCEQLTFGHARRHHLRVTAIRLFNVVGARQTDRVVVPTFLGQARRNEAITLHGDGTQSRCFTDVRDAVEGLVRLADCDAAVDETINIGSRNELSVRQLAQHVKSVTGSDSSIETVPYDFQMIPSRVPCLGKARQLIG
jgi:UDP-glucose 4-epimerase